MFSFPRWTCARTPNTPCNLFTSDLLGVVVQDCFVVIASDGVWGPVSDGEARFGWPLAGELSTSNASRISRQCLQMP